ncbi:MAG: putative alpha/beta-fold hydrolase, partial [Saprospiraceae bacterium]
MPLFNESSFRTPFYFSNRHLQTIYPAVFRKVDGVEYTREKMVTNDGDFIDLDFSKVFSNKIVLVLHGLEGSAERPYVQGIIKIFNKNGWDGVVLNFRGCGGTPNLKPRTYHSGETGDINEVIDHLAKESHYKEIAIIGFSLGGNVTLKYVGEQSNKLYPLIKKAVAFSVPCHLESASVELSKWYNAVYMKRFMDGLKEKVKNRETIFKDIVDLEKVYASKSFLDFDEYFTAPVHGFTSAVDYWTKSSSKQFLKDISIPTLLVNAKDDSFLSAECYPFEEAEALENFFLEVPDKGGHVG